MATILRSLSYEYQWFYDTISRALALSVGGETRFRQLALRGLPIQADTEILDLCCGCGQTTQFLVQRSDRVTGLDASPKSLARARRHVPQASYVEGWAEAMPLPDNRFDLVHSSVALHEMQPEQLQAILREVWRVLKPGGYFAVIDLHQPTFPPMWLGLAPFMWIFETETAWQFVRTDLPQLLTETGFTVTQTQHHAGGSLQVVQAQKLAIAEVNRSN